MAMSSYIDGDFPPGHRDDMSSYFRVARNLARAHLAAYELIHQLRSTQGYQDTRVGYAMHYTVLQPHEQHPLTVLPCKVQDNLFHRIFEAAFLEGKLLPPLGRNERLTLRTCSCDFLGINYYTRHIIYPNKKVSMLFGEARTGYGLDRGELTDMGWEIYPDGLFQVCKRAYTRYPLPVYITENGIADATDALRRAYLLRHLQAVHRLLEEGVPVERYYHWSFWDNLEWNFGYEKRFGLVEVNQETGERLPRPSAYLYADVIKARGISDELQKEYSL